MIIILNAPPASGKDTIGSLMMDGTDLVPLSFKSPMFEIAASLLGGNYNTFIGLYNDRDTKEVPTNICGGKSPRQFMIHISESVCKPLFGSDYFGKRLSEGLSADANYVITDGGFPEEVQPLLSSGQSVVIVRLFRKGFDFKGDSRRYLTEDDFSELPLFQRPRFLDVRLIEGYPEEAVSYIISKFM